MTGECNDDRGFGFDGEMRATGDFMPSMPGEDPEDVRAAGENGVDRGVRIRSVRATTAPTTSSVLSVEARREAATTVATVDDNNVKHVGWCRSSVPRKETPLRWNVDALPGPSAVVRCSSVFSADVEAAGSLCDGNRSNASRMHHIFNRATGC